MTATVLDNIGLLVTNDSTIGDGPLGIRRDVALVIEGDRIGAIERVGAVVGDRRIDIEGRCVLPGFVDSHTHLVFAGDRSDEFVARMSGRPYEAGGIGLTRTATRRASDDELTTLARQRRREGLRAGITHVEIKSGYGLDVASEERLCRIAGSLTDDVTFLGAHLIPSEFAAKPDDYVDLVVGEMLAACAPHARWIDVFCEQGAFDADQSRRVLEAGKAAGLGARVHANQLGHGHGVRIAVEAGAASADHCTYLTDADIGALAASDTVATLLPAADFSTRQPYPDARRIIDAGVTTALATNTNPGSSYTTAMAFCIALAVRDMYMTIEEAVWSATAGGAAALRRTDIGRLVPEARADLQVIDAPSYTHLVYRPGVPLVHRVFVSGAEVVSPSGDQQAP